MRVEHSDPFKALYEERFEIEFVHVETVIAGTPEAPGGRRERVYDKISRLGERVAGPRERATEQE